MTFTLKREDKEILRVRVGLKTKVPVNVGFECLKVKTVSEGRVGENFNLSKSLSDRDKCDFLIWYLIGLPSVKLFAHMEIDELSKYAETNWVFTFQIFLFNL